MTAQERDSVTFANPEVRARQSSGDKGGVLDTKPYIQHDPQLGYRYLPNVNLTLPRPGGGSYHFQTNAQGIRSSRDYSPTKYPGTTRIILCGDSMPAGQFVSNEQRLSEQLERCVPSLEVINLSLEGSGTDQQLLLYENVGLKYEHDLVVLMPFLSNLRRNMVMAREAIDAKTGSIVLRAKPRFELVDDTLELRNIPVPQESVPGDGAPMKTDSDNTLLANVKTKISALPAVSFLKKLAYSFVPWEPFPEFRDARSPQWQLMEAIVHRFKASAAKRPLVIVPTFYDSYVRYRMSRAYWDRFESLRRIPGVYVIDLLPHFQNLGVDAIRCFQVPYDIHFSSFGHLVVTDILKEELTRLGLLAEHGAGRQ
jgi:hypothetical protein